eukprot:Gb_05115 [translate_table: standard]
MGRAPCCEKVGLKKGPWTPEEDQKLLAYIQEHGHGSWRALPLNAGLLRCGKSCRLRWTNYLRPDIKRGKFTLQEEQTIIQLHALLGNRWSTIATHLPKRTDNEIKNYWNTHLKKRLSKMGIDPVTHKPKSDSLNLLEGQYKDTSALSHMAQWESARLEAEARLARESKQRITKAGLWPKNSTDLFMNKTWKRNLSLPTTSYSPTSCLNALNMKLLQSSNKPPNSSLFGSNVTITQQSKTLWPSIDHLIESPTSTLSFMEGNTRRHSSDSGTNGSYFSLVHQALCPSKRSQAQIHKSLHLHQTDSNSAQELKPLREELSLLLKADNNDRNDVKSSNHEDQTLDDNCLLFPFFQDFITFPDDHNCCNTTKSASSPEERSALEFSRTEEAAGPNEISSNGIDLIKSGINYDGFNTDLLFDLADGPRDCELPACSETSTDQDQSSMNEDIMTENKDYWSNILNMVNSPEGHSSDVRNIF